MVSHGAGAEIPQTSVFFGMLMTPVFYLLVRKITGKLSHLASLSGVSDERQVIEQASD